MIEDVVIRFEDPVGEPVVAHELPDIFHRVELRRFRRQRQEGDVVWDRKLLRDMPSRLIEKNERMRVGRDRKRDFFQMKRHGLAVAGGEDEPSAFSIGRTDGAEDIGRCRPLIMRRGGACSTLGPAAGDLVLLPDAGFVLT